VQVLLQSTCSGAVAVSLQLQISKVTKEELMSYDRKYLVWALSYAVVGMCLGIFMAASHNHAQHVTHAHIMLVGFVVSLSYGVIHKLWLSERPATLAKIQFIAHHTGAVMMFTGLLLYYGEMVALAQIEPLLSLASISVLSAALLMLVMAVKANRIHAREQDEAGIIEQGSRGVAVADDA
jgi:hypothetical protein